MSEPIVYHPWKVTSVAGKGLSDAANHSSASRPFSDILAEAEAVRDDVRLHERKGSGGLGALASNAVLGTIALLSRPVPGIGQLNVRERQRRASAAHALPEDGHSA